MELVKIYTDKDFENSVIPEGQILTYIGTDENGKVVTRYKDSQGNTGTIAGGGDDIDTSDATVTADKLLKGVIAYGADGKVTGNIETVTPTQTDNVFTVASGFIAEPKTLTVPESGELSVSDNIVTVPSGYSKIERKATVPEATAPTTSGNVVTVNKGYQASQKEVTVGTAKSAATITPGTSDIIIAKGTYLSGNQTIKGDANLIADNIKEGVSIFGVSGTLSSAPIETISYIVSGGGSTAYNGVYVDRNVMVAGKPSYVNDNGKYLCYTEDYGWIIGDYLNADDPMCYHNGSPDITSGYSIEAGDEPSPVVSKYDPYANLVAENIKSGVVINNITGTFTSDADASATDIAAGKTAYVNGEKVVGIATGSSSGNDCDYYKCASVDTANKNWAGYKAIFEDGVYSFSATESALSYGDFFTPSIGGIYNSDCTVQIKSLYTGVDETLVFYAPLTSSSDTAETGQTMTVSGNVEYSNIENRECAYFNGNSKLIISNVSALPFGNAQHTICGWFRYSEFNPYSGLLGYGYEYAIRTISRYGECDVVYYDNTGGAFSYRLEADRWYHIATTWDGSKIVLYLNGVKEAENSEAPSYVRDDSKPLWIGGVPRTGTATGYVSDVRIYNRALSADEIATLAQN